ncbi:MAG: hypothetical protein EBU36_07335, partial [Verrucomicrobia bacterium]|nr:hypothetical protein [Verrucomicrobiota bacterium]
VDKVKLFADRFSLFPDASSTQLVTAGAVAIAPYTNQRPVNLGTSSVAGSTSFTLGDLQRFNVNDLVVGRRDPASPQVGAGVVTVSAALASDSLRVLNGLVLANTRQMTDQGGVTGLSFKNVVLDAGGQVTFTGSGNSIQYLSGVIRDTALADNASFTMSSLLRTSTSTSASLPLTIGEVFTDVAYATGKRFYQGITTQDGDIRIFADQLQQTRVVGFLDTTSGGLYAASTAEVTLAPLTAGRGISIYSSTPVTDTLGLRIGNPQAPGLELVRAKSLVIGSGNLRNIQLATPGFGYVAPPAVYVNGQSGIAEAVLERDGYQINGVTYFQLAGIRISNPMGTYTSAPTITVASPSSTGSSLPGSSSATATATLGAAGAITLNSNLSYNYVQYPQAPFDVTLATGSSITAQAAQLPPSNTSSIIAGGLRVLAGGAVQLAGVNDVDELSAILTGSGSAANLSFADSDFIRLGRVSVPGTLTITAAGAITQSSDGVTTGTGASFTTGAGAITLGSANNSFSGSVSAVNTSGGITLVNSAALSLGT